MDPYSKQRRARIISIACLIFVVFCMSRMIPYGLNGEAGKVKLYFFLIMIAIIVAIPNAIAYQYYRDMEENEDIENMRTRINIISRIRRKSRKAMSTKPLVNKSKK